MKILLRCQKFLSIDKLKLIFNAIGLSYLNYGAALYANADKGNLTEIRTKYIECGRAMLGKRYRHHVSTNIVLDTLKWKSFESVMLSSRLILIFKSIHGSAPSYLQSCFHHQNSRTLNYYIPRIHLSSTKSAFSYWGPFLWSLLPTEVKLLGYNDFKRAILKPDFNIDL